MTGAGFGGCTVTLVHKNGLSDLRAKLKAYEARFSLTPEMFVLDRNLEAGDLTDH
jgi:galactokinase